MMTLMSVTLSPENVFDENEQGSEAGHSYQDFGEGAMDETHVTFHHFSTVRQTRPAFHSASTRPAF
jgi:hypothetical protein